MTQTEYQDCLRLARGFDADYLSDMGGELTEAYLDRQPPVVGALEATTSGLNRLKSYALPFPVFDWNSIPLKEQIENRFHVGDGVWLTFAHLTAMGLFGRRVLVIGYGPVGKGIAERARQLGANVYVSDLDPVKLLEARVPRLRTDPAGGRAGALPDHRHFDRGGGDFAGAPIASGTAGGDRF